MSRIAPLLVAAILTACACSAVGCDNRIRFLPELDLQRGMDYEVEACLDERCEHATLNVDGPATQTADVEGALTLWEDADRVELAIGDGDFGGSHAVSFVILDSAGVTIAEFAGEVELTPSQPNGAFCQPTCWSAQVGP